MTRYVTDVEADSLEPTRIWCVVDIDIDTGEEHVWRYDTATEPYSRTASLRIGHNFLDFDGPVLRKFFPESRIDYKRVIDTLVCSRLFNQQVANGHSLEAWGQRLGERKSDFHEFSAYDDPVLERDRMDRCVAYCLQDCRVNLKLYNFFKKHIENPRWKQSLRLEHDTAIICRELHDNGFAFAYDSARGIEAELTVLVDNLERELLSAFKPRSKLIREVTPKSTKFGTLSRTDFRWAGSVDLSQYSADAPFSRFEYVPFNPGSPKAVVERLNEAGWKPFEKTDGYKDCEKELRQVQRGRRPDRKRIQELTEKLSEYEIYGWKISEENLETLPDDAPEGCRLFVKWRMLSKRLQTLQEWFDAYDSNTNRIHGKFTHIGAWTHRFSHSGPNMGNVPSVDSKYHSPELKLLAKTYGARMRACWHVPEGKRLVGTDAEGIQLRILAHYMNDVEFIEALISGKKDDEHPERSTDVHTLNAIKLGFDYRVRPRAKTFIYAWLLGAGLGKVAKILGISLEEARKAVEQFIAGYPGLTHLKNVTIPDDASRGYFEGFDGRLVRSDEYHMLAGYLQNGEQAIMKYATQVWYAELMMSKIPFKLVNFVHDEWQTEVDDRFAEEVAHIQARSIVTAGEHFKLNCPMAGSFKIGKNWHETH